MTLNEKASYIKGLVDGFNLNKEKEENKAIYAIIDFLYDIAESVSELEDRVDEVEDELEDINDLIEETDLDDDLDDDTDSVPNTESSADDMYYEIECPSCNTKVCLTEDTLIDNDVNCPNCGSEIKVCIENSCKCENHDCEECD